MRSWSSFEIGALLLALLVGLAAGFALTLDSLQAAPAAATKTIGSVIYKLRTAETRHNDQAVWSVLPQNSPVFELDTVRTASESAADVVLGKTTKVALGPDTMIRLELGGQALNVVRGTVRLKSKAGQAITVKTNAAAVTVSQGEAILSTDGTKTTTTVVEGTASMVSQGASQELSAGKSAAVDAGGVAAAVTVQPESPTAGEVIWTDQKTAAIDLRWTAPDGWQGRLMIGPTKDLKKPVVEQTVSGGLLQTTLAPGVWWWSLGDSTVPAQRFEVKPLPVPQLIRPASGAVAASADNPELDVRWTPVTGASEYRVEVFAQADLKTPEVSQTTGGTSLQLNVVSTGDHLVRVVAVFETLGLESITLARPFTVGTSLKVPLQWRNSTGEALQLNRAQVGGEAGALHWQADPGSRFRVRVGADQAMTKIVSDRVVQGDTYRLEDSLPEGTYYVEISRQESGARLASSSDLIRRTVVYTKPSPPVAVSPGQGLLVAPEAGQLTLSYEDPNDSPRIQVEVAADPAFSGALAKARGGRERPWSPCPRRRRKPSTGGSKSWMTRKACWLPLRPNPSGSPWCSTRPSC